MSLTEAARQEAMALGAQAGTIQEATTAVAATYEAEMPGFGDVGFDLSKIPKDVWNQVLSKQETMDPTTGVERQQEIADATIRAAIQGVKVPANSVGAAIPSVASTPEDLKIPETMTAPTVVLPAESLPPVQAGPPQYQICVEEKGSRLQHEVFYHQVIGTDACLVLVSDNRVVGYPRMNFRPPEEGDEADRPLAVRIKGQAAIYEVRPTKFAFTLENYSVTILEIIAAHEVLDA